MDGDVDSAGRTQLASNWTGEKRDVAAVVPKPVTTNAVAAQLGLLLAMNRTRKNMKIIGLCGLLSAITLCWPAEIRADAPRPNIVLIMCDDMGFSDIGCYGGEVETPNLDQLAADGMRFTQFYNNAKCTTTRASILTGLYPRFGRGGHLRSDMITIGEALKLAGYKTSLSGKWHLLKTSSSKKDQPGSWHEQFDKSTHPFYRGFDRYYGVLDGCCNFFDPRLPDPPYKGGRIRNFGQDGEAVTEFPAAYYTTDAFTDHAIESIRDFSEEDSPFLIHICYTAPHYPLHAKPKDIAKYRGRFLKGWEQMRRDRWKNQQKLGLVDDSWQLTSTDSRSYDWSSADQAFEDFRMSVYAAMIDSMDQNIGRLVEALRATGELENTLLLFLSDNGGCAEEPGGRDPEIRTPGPADDYVAVGPAWGWAQNAPFRRYKSWVHEGGITTAMIAHWPGQIRGNTINRSPAHIIDLLPTFLELAGTAYPKSYHEHLILPCEGKSIARLLRGESRDAPEYLAWYWSGNRAIRQGDMKLVWDKLVKQWELYDLSEDRCEMSDLASQLPEQVSRLSSKYKQWAANVELKIE